MTTSSKPQFLRFLDAANASRRAHLQDVFMSMFVAVVRVDAEANEAPATVPNMDDLLGAPASANGCKRDHNGNGYTGNGHAADVAFACVRCGSPSVILPAELTDESEVRCGSCCHALMTWKSFKSLCDRRTAQLDHD